MMPVGRKRGAFTLLEVLIVLALLVTAVSVCWPQLARLHAEYSVRQGGKLVQARMAGARVHAVDTGVDYQFRFEPGGQRFLVLPYDQQALTAAANAAGAGGGSAGASATRLPPKIAGRLASAEAQFDPASTGGQAPQPVPSEWLTGIHDAEKFTDANWSAPLLFYPDGTAATGHVIIRDKKSRMVVVSVRALTGAVSVSPLENGAPR